MKNEEKADRIISGGRPDELSAELCNLRLICRARSFFREENAKVVIDAVMPDSGEPASIGSFHSPAMLKAAIPTVLGPRDEPKIFAAIIETVTVYMVNDKSGAGRPQEELVKPHRAPFDMRARIANRR